MTKGKRRACTIIMLIGLGLGLGACSWLFGDPDETNSSGSSASSRGNGSSGSSTSTTKKAEFPNVNEVPTERPSARAADTAGAPKGLPADDQNRQHTNPAPRQYAAPAPRPKPSIVPTQSSPNVANSGPTSKSTTSSGVGQVAVAQQQKPDTVPTPQAKPGNDGASGPGRVTLKPLPPPGNYTGRAPFPGEDGYLYGSYPTVKPRATAQALYVSPYGSGIDANPSGFISGATVLFGNNSTKMSPLDQARIHAVARTALIYGKIVQVYGHASANRSAQQQAKNIELSLARARAVASQLQVFGLPAGMIQFGGFGEQYSSGHRETAAIDRRVDVFFVN